MPEEMRTLTIRLPIRLKVALQQWAVEREMTFTDLLLKGAAMYSAFTDGFLSEMQKVAANLEVGDVAVVMQQLLVSYANSERADIDVFKSKSKTFSRAFQYDDHGLIKGDRHADLVYEQRKADNLKLLAKATVAAKTAEPTLYTCEEMATVANAIAAG